MDHLEEFLAVIRVADHDALRFQFDLCRFGIDVDVVHQRLVDIFKGVVRFDADAVGVEDERVAGNARRPLVGLAETAVDADFLAFRPDRAFAFLDLDRRMAVDDVSLRRVDAEFVEDLDAFVFIAIQAVVGILRFFPRRFVYDVTPFKSLDDAAGYRGIGTAPEVPHIVQAVSIALVISPADEVFRLIHEGFALIRLTVEVDFLKAAVLVEGQAAVEQEVVIHAAV